MNMLLREFKLFIGSSIFVWVYLIILLLGGVTRIAEAACGILLVSIFIFPLIIIWGIIVPVGNIYFHLKIKKAVHKGRIVVFFTLSWVLFNLAYNGIITGYQTYEEIYVFGGVEGHKSLEDKLKTYINKNYENVDNIYYSTKSALFVPQNESQMNRDNVPMVIANFQIKGKGTGCVTVEYVNHKWQEPDERYHSVNK